MASTAVFASPASFTLHANCVARRKMNSVPKACGQRRLDMSSAKSWRSSVRTRKALVCRAFRGGHPEADGSEDEDGSNFNFSFPSDMGWKGASRSRSVSWGNLEDLSEVPNERHVYILVFGAGTGNEGVYSLQERTREDVPVDIILAFPSYEDASRYATLLEAEMNQTPIVEAALPNELMYTCAEGGYRCKVARRGALLVPPEKTVEMTDWERANALRKGQWTVAEEDSSDGCAVMAGAAGGTDTATCQAEEEEIDVVAKEAEEEEEANQFNVEEARSMLFRMFDQPGSTENGEEL